MTFSEQMKQYEIFDIHTHTYPEALAERATESLGRFYNFHVNGKGTYDDMENSARAFNVRGFLLFSVCTNAHQVQKVNTTIAELAELSRSHGYETVGFAGMHQDYVDFKGELERARSLGLYGVKLHPDIQGVDIDDERLLPLYALMEGVMPLYLHMGDDRTEYRYSEAKKLVRVLEMFPELEVVAAHLGGYKAWSEAEEYLAGRKNVWFDTSSALWAMTPEYAKHLIDVFGSDRIMFGTDYPVVELEDELKRFMAIDLNEKERRDILCGNAMRFFKRYVKKSPHI